MRELILAGALALSTATCPAQTTQPADSHQGPANLCQDLLSFMKAPLEAATPATSKLATTEKQAPPAKSEPGQQSSSASADTTATDKNASEGADKGSAQAITGQDGVATDAPDPAKDNAASGSVANAPQKESRAAPVPPSDTTSTPKESVLTVEAAQKLADANDIEQCQKMARKMRVAGVAMPPPLIALTALDLQYQQKSGPTAAPAGPAE